MALGGASQRPAWEVPRLMRQRESQEAEGSLDNALLELMLDNPAPWSAAELARTTSLPGDIPAALARLSYDGLINRWGDLSTPTFAAARFFGIHHERSEPECERIREHAVLETLFAREGKGRRSVSRKKLLRAMQVKKKNKIAYVDAITSLRAAGLLLEPAKRVLLSKAALRFDQIAA
ncbi:MAG: hypothetical protein ACRDLF_00665 [Solirubrobacteraceae bacterium]